MNIVRLIRHMATTRWSTRRHFPQAVRDAIEQAIGECESSHGGEIRFVIETAFDIPELWRELSARTRALPLFGQFGVWNTEHNNGVLIYVLMADHDVEIVDDRGIDARVSQGEGDAVRALAPGVPHAEWDALCRQMEHDYLDGRFRDGSVVGILGVGALLGRHF